MNQLKKVASKLKALVILRVFFSLSSLLVYLVNPTSALAQSDFQTGEAVNGVATIKGFERVFANLVTVSLAFGGIVLFVMFLIGGLKYMNAQGDPKATEAAKGTLTHAIYGIVILALAFVFLAVIQQITGAKITTFKVTN